MNSNLTLLKKTALSFAMSTALLVSPAAFATTCTEGCGRPGVQAVNKLYEAWHEKFKEMVDELLHAEKVKAGEEAIQKNKNKLSRIDAAKSEAESQKNELTNKNIIDAFISFSKFTGQGFDPCGTMIRASRARQANQELGKVAETTFGKMNNAAGNYTMTVRDFKKKQRETHFTDFCTEAEDKANLCEKADEKLAGADLTVSTCFETMEPNSKHVEACNAAISNALGPVPGVISSKAQETPTGKTAIAMALNTAAMRDIAQYTLTMIAAGNTKNPAYDNKSPNELMAEMVGVYMGKDSHSWAKTIAGQSVRGLLLEATKMEGLGAWMRFQKYQKLMRSEMNIAALLLDSTKFDVEAANAIQIQADLETAR